MEEAQLRLLRFLDLLGKRFDFSTLDHRIEVQKLVFLAREFGFNFSYTYNWYLHGPYSTQLADDGYAINDSFGALYPKMQSFQDREVCQDPTTIHRFVDFVGPYTNDSKWLEIAASLIWIRKYHYTDIPLAQCRDSLIRDVAFVYKKFDPCNVLDVLNRLEEFQIIV